MQGCVRYSQKSIYMIHSFSLSIVHKYIRQEHNIHDNLYFIFQIAFYKILYLYTNLQFFSYFQNSRHLYKTFFDNSPYRSYNILICTSFCNSLFHHNQVSRLYIILGIMFYCIYIELVHFSVMVVKTLIDVYFF